MHDVALGIISKGVGAEVGYLLVSVKKDFGPLTGLYFPPGGHVEDGETEEEALIREIHEELGLVVHPQKKLASMPGDNPGKMLHLWLCEVEPGDMVIDHADIADVGYFTRSQMGALPLFPSTRKFFDEYIFI